MDNQIDKNIRLVIIIFKKIYVIYILNSLIYIYSLYKEYRKKISSSKHLIRQS